MSLLQHHDSGTAFTRPSLNDRVQAIAGKISYRLIQSTPDREDVYRLRYRAYLREGAISKSRNELLRDAYDETRNGHTYGLYHGSVLLSSIRIHVVCRQNPSSPAVETFGDHLTPLIEQGLTIIDPNRFVADPGATRQFPDLHYFTLRLPFMAGTFYNADLITATVRAEHQAFYKRVLLCQPVCSPRAYPTLLKPLSLMTADYPKVKGPIVMRYPFFSSSREERESIFLAEQTLGAEGHSVGNATLI